MFVGLSAGSPSRKHLRHWERVCLYLDSRPYRSVAYPFPSEPPITARLLKRMAHFGLVRHRDDCHWRLSLRWRSILKRLWEASDDDTKTSVYEDVETRPFIADQGIDTLYTNLYTLALPSALSEQCAELKAMAQELDSPVETPWRLFDASLSMWKAGVGTSEKNRGVSWSYLLRNSLVMVRLRRAPLQRLIGSVRFSSELLWTYGPRPALDGVKALLAQMWGDEEAFEHTQWQLSQLHLCVDVANFAPEPADLERIVTYSRKKAIHIPSLEEESSLIVGSSDDIDDYFDDVPPEWDDLPSDFFVDAALLDGELPDDDEGELSDEDEDNSGDEDITPADEGGAVVHLWGRRASGFAFSPGAPISAVWYNKALEERHSGKGWMQEIHKAGGWSPDMPLTRVEGRLTRDIFREIAVGMGLEEGDWCDNPEYALDHCHDFWGYIVGLPPEHDHAPDATHRGWMRLTLPSEDDANRSRWPTDPVWEVIQRATFNATKPPIPLHRDKRIVHELEKIDAELYGLMKLRSVICERQHDTRLTLTKELESFAARMKMVDRERERDYYEEVREKARMLGRAVPMKVQMILPSPMSHRVRGGPKVS